MLTRLTHAAISFALTVVVYQAYVLMVAPFIEPTAVHARSEQSLNSTVPQPPPVAPHKYRELLAAYFPVGHWTLASAPITFEAGNAMIVLDDYQPRDDGQVRVTKCVMLFFPKPRVRGEPPPRDAVVLEAPHGAVLQMDQGLRPGLGGMGRIQWGRLVGDIVVRSGMREPGPQDDLLLTTRDLYMNEDLIRTDDKVEMQVGPHWGRGRVLEIRLVAVERAHANLAGPQIGGIDSLEILHDVRAQLAPGDVRLFAEQKAAAPARPSPPVKIASRGRFRFDFANNMASFVDQVQVVQEHDTGQRDQLYCDELNIYLAGADDTVLPAANETDTLTAVGTKTHDLARLRPGSIEARGSDDAPVILDAPSQMASARCDRMRLELDARRVTFDGSDEVVLKYDGSEIHAPLVRYQAPAQGSAERIGALLAAGSGWIRALAGDNKSQPFEVRWTDSMRLERVNGQPELSLRGRPRLDMVGMGTLWANYLNVVLRERKADGSEADLLPGDVVPQRIVASGLVGIESPELSGKVDELDVNIDYQPSELQLADPTGANSRGDRLLLGKRGNEPRAYNVVGNQLRVQLTVRQRRPEVSSLGVEGGVVFRETSAGAAAGEPLVVRAERLTVKDADSPNAEIDLRGQPATITAAGMTIHAETLRLNRGTSRAWIDSPGQLELPLDRNLNGEQLATPEPLAISWQKGMELDQDRITFRGQVSALTSDGVLNTERLVAVLNAPVRFDGAARQGRTELEQLECWEGVRAEFQQRDAAGLISMQVMELESIVANQRTGEIKGDGPGQLESVHLTQGGNPLGQFAPGATNLPRTAQHLGFLHVDFRRGVRGNLHSRQIEVFGDTKAVYGPVDSWQQKLEISLRGKPGPGTIWITSDRLGVAENPAGRAGRDGGIGAVELSARDNVTIEGRAGERGMFTARAQRATYDQLKTMFILEGDGTRPAELYHQEYDGAPTTSNSARKLTYIQSTGEVKLEGIVKGEWSQIDLGNSPGKTQSK